VIDPELVRFSVVTRLPERVRWQIDKTPYDLDFSRSRKPLRPISPEEAGDDIAPDWASLLLFGETDFASGGGAAPFIGAHRETGEVYGLDIELDANEMFLFNSNVNAFIETFHLFDQALRLHTRKVSELDQAARSVDPAVFQKSDWRLLLEQLVRP
jgi:SUKH-4 immunity protein of toxin-antitoxin system